MNPTLILDIVVVALLVPTLVFAAILNSRLTALRKNRDQLGRLINSFNEATVRAESGVPKLKKAAEEAAQSLQVHVEKAQTLRDDLAYMIDRAESMANRLEGTVRAARVEPKAPAKAPPPSPRRSSFTANAAPAPAAADSGGPVEDDRSEAERELLRALQSVR